MKLAAQIADSILADLRNRHELTKILGPIKPDDGTPHISAEQQTKIELRMVEIIETIAADYVGDSDTEVARQYRRRQELEKRVEFLESIIAESKSTHILYNKESQNV